MFNGDFENFLDFLSQSKFHSDADSSLVKEIIQDIATYDVFDVISKVAALKLIETNFNKTIRLEYFTKAILTLDPKECNSGYKISTGKFNNIMRKLADLDICRNEDPPENPFIDRVLFYGNYSIFSGIGESPSFLLQTLINVIFKFDNEFDVVLKSRVYRVIEGFLTLSDSIISSLGIDYSKLTNKFNPELLIPGSNKLSELISLISYDKLSICELLDYDTDVIGQIFVSIGDLSDDDMTDMNCLKLVKSPFVLARDGTAIISDVGILPYTICFYVLHLFSEYGSLAKLTSTCNKYVWSTCLKTLGEMNYKRLRAGQFEIDMFENSYYYEAILNIDTNKIFFVQAILDDLEGFSRNSIFSNIELPLIDEMVNERRKYIHTKLRQFGVNEFAILDLYIPFSLGCRSFMVKIDKQECYTDTIKLSPDELHYINVNERENLLFLPRYIYARSKIKSLEVVGSELNSIEIYSFNDCSFYNDDFNPENTTLIIPMGDCVDYKLKSIKKEDYHLVDSKIPDSLVEVCRNDRYLPIYRNIAVNSWKSIDLYVEMRNISFWISSKSIYDIKEFDLNYSFVDLTSYWLSFLDDVFLHNHQYKVMKIILLLDAPLVDYYLSMPGEKDSCLDEELRWKITNDTVEVFISPKVVKLFKCNTNKVEKQFIKTIINIICECIQIDRLNDAIIDKIFSNPDHKKMLTFDITNNPFYKPIAISKKRHIYSADENLILDELGATIIKSMNLGIGRISLEKSKELSREVVSHLYNEIKMITRTYNPEGLIEMLVYEFENTVQKLLTNRTRLYYDCLCYPADKEYILQRNNGLNKLSLAQRFLIEYIVAEEPNGTKRINELEYEYILALCSMLINWAYKNDYYHYNLDKSPMEILKSGRIGSDKTLIERIEHVTVEAFNQQLLSLNISFMDQNKIIDTPLKKYYQDVSVAFVAEYGFSLDDYFRVIFSILAFGDKEETEVKKFNVCLLHENLADELIIPRDMVARILDHLTLLKRDDYLTPQAPYTKVDVYPWRFNRELSFFRRPLIMKNDEYIWGNRNLFHTIHYVLHLLAEGMYKARSIELRKAIGRISEERGKQFNDRVYSRIKGHGMYDVHKNLRKVNGKRIVDQRNYELGDIDIVIINREKRIIYIVETKDFNLSRNAYELACEYRDMFVDEGNKKSFLSRHNARVNWINTHIDDLLLHFNLLSGKWHVKDFFIIGEELVSNHLNETGKTIISIDGITNKFLANL